MPTKQEIFKFILGDQLDQSIEALNKRFEEGYLIMNIIDKNDTMLLILLGKQ